MAQKVFIIHGWTYTLDKWTDVTAELESAGLEVKMLKVPGLSEPSDEVWGVPQYVKWLRDKLENEKHPVVVGHSNGGRIAMAYDRTYPKHLKKLFLIASAGVANSETSSLSLKKRIARIIGTVVKPVTTPAIRRKLSRLIGSTDYGSARPNMRETMQNLWRYDQTEFDASKVSVSVTLIWGEHDTATPLTDAEQLLAGLPHADDLHIIHGAGHSPQADNPKQVAELIANNLQ